MKLTKTGLISLIKEEISKIQESALDGPTRTDKLPKGPPPNVPPPPPGKMPPPGPSKPTNKPDPLMDTTVAVPEKSSNAMGLIVKELEVLIKKIKAAM